MIFISFLLSTGGGYGIHFNKPPKKKKEPIELTPLETIFQKKTKTREDLNTLMEMTEKDLVTMDRIFDGFVDMHMNSVDSFGMLACFVILYQCKVYKKKNVKTKKKNTLSFPLFALSVLFHLTRNIKPVE